jgi:hypothetical protein
MTCHSVRKQLSLYVDAMLKERAAVAVSAHLAFCSSCRAESDRLALLRSRLADLKRAEDGAPAYLRKLVDMRLARERRDTLFSSVREAWEYRWSRIRTMEVLWWATRLTGTAASFVLFFALYTAMSPLEMPFPAASADRGAWTTMRQQLPQNVLRNLGYITVEAQRRPISPSDPRINDLYFLNFGQSVSRRGADDSFSVVTVIDRSGAAKIQNVLEYPADSTLLDNFNSMLQSARCRPASYNGHAVDSHLVLSFSKISVYD